MVPSVVVVCTAVVPVAMSVVVVVVVLCAITAWLARIAAAIAVSLNMFLADFIFFFRVRGC